MLFQIADTLSLLGLCTQRAGRNAEAEGYIRKALGIVEAAETPDKMEVTASQSSHNSRHLLVPMLVHKLGPYCVGRVTFESLLVIP